MSRRKKLTNNSGIPQHEIENIARILLPDILAFYESEAGQREFAEWKAARDGAKTDKDSKDVYKRQSSETATTKSISMCVSPGMRTRTG